MLVAMAVLGLTTYALLLSQPHLLTSLAQSDPGPAFQESPHTCTHADKESVWSQLPHCEPRNTLVKSSTRWYPDCHKLHILNR